MNTELDCYGMTPEERAEFDRWFLSGPTPPNTTALLYGPGCGDIVERIEHAEAIGWAACAKLYRERLEVQKRALKTFQTVNRESALCRARSEFQEQIQKSAADIAGVKLANSALTDEVEKLQIGNNALLARIKEMESENKQICEQHEVAANEVRQLMVENERLKSEIEDLRDTVDEMNQYIKDYQND